MGVQTYLMVTAKQVGGARWGVLPRAALAAVAAVLITAQTASAASFPAPETRVGVSTVAVASFVKAGGNVAAGQRRDNASAQPQPASATSVAAEAGDGATVQLFRHAGPDELADLKASGRFNLGPNSTGKYFAGNAEDAAKWGEWLNKGEGGVVSTSVPKSFADQLMYWEKLDGIGPAWFVPPEQLDALNALMRGIEYP
jgi:hypothetical protein